MFKGQKFTYLEMHEVKPVTVRTTSKHAASKKGYKHQHNLSEGQMKDYQKRMDANQKWFS